MHLVYAVKEKRNKKMMKRVVVLSSTIAMSCCAITALAKEPAFLKNKSFYLQANVGFADEEWQSFQPLSSWSFNEAAHSGVGFGGLLGTSVYKNVSMEVGGEILPTAEYKDQGKQYDISQSLFYVASRLNARYSSTIDLYARLGLAYRHLYNSQKSVGSGGLVGPVFGLGAEYQFSQVLFLGADFTHDPGEFARTKKAELAPNLNLFSLTFTYRFKG